MLWKAWHVGVAYSPATFEGRVSPSNLADRLLPLVDPMRNSCWFARTVPEEDCHQETLRFHGPEAPDHRMAASELQNVKGAPLQGCL